MYEPYGHFLLAEIREQKKQYKKIHKEIMQIEDNLMREEHKACSKCERTRVLRSILSQAPTYYKIDSNKRPNCKNISQSTKRIYFEWNVAIMSYIYNGKFSGNILVVGRTGCGKTALVQKLAVNKLFGELIKAEWVSYIKLDKQREAELQSWFDCQLDFYYPRNKEQFENLLQYFKTKSNSTEPDDTHSDKDFSVDNVNYGENYGEKSNRNHLIVMDDVSGLADSSIKFGSFLTVARKFKYHCLYIFHMIHPEKSVWKTILSQTNLLNIFPASVPINTVTKVLEANCIRKTTKYNPVNSLWITKLFIQLANNESEKTCLTIDCTGFNPNGPGRFRTDTANPERQTCFF